MGKSHKNEKKSKKKHKHKERKDKKKAKKLKKHTKNMPILENETNSCTNISEPDSRDFAIPLELMNSKSHAPETPEEYQKRQSRIRREVDPCTGRKRLIKGDGEVLEEIVSKETHKAINKVATKGDGAYFEETTLGRLDE